MGVVGCFCGGVDCLVDLPSGLGCLMLYIVACLFIALAVVGWLLLDLICCVCALVVCFVYYVVVYFGVLCG